MKRILSMIIALAMAFTIWVVPTGTASADDGLMQASAVKKVKCLRTTATSTNSITVKWNAVSGVKYYVVKVNGVKKLQTKKTSYTAKKLTAGKHYTFKVLAYGEVEVTPPPVDPPAPPEDPEDPSGDGDGDGGDDPVDPVDPPAPVKEIKLIAQSGVLKSATKPKKVSIKSLSSSVPYVTVNWYKKKGDGYQIRYSRYDDFHSCKSVKVTSPATLQKKLQGLKDNKIYYIKVRAYTKTTVYRYGAWSKVKTVKTHTTGWKTLSNRMRYYKNGEALKGDQELDGNPYFFSKKDGTLIGASYEMYDQIDSCSSKTDYLVAVSRELNRLCVYRKAKDKNQWVVYKYFKCTTGAASTPSPKGYYTVPENDKKLYFGNSKGYTCWYATRISGYVMFHSVLCAVGSKAITDGRLGMNLSHGCIRLSLTDAKWIYDHIFHGTKVRIY